MGYEVELTDEAKDFIAEKGYDRQFGARPLQRAIQKYLEDPIADEILAGLKEGDTLVAGLDKDEDKLVMSVKKGEPKAEAATESAEDVSEEAAEAETETEE